jgi:hypothetical protein
MELDGRTINTTPTKTSQVIEALLKSNERLMDMNMNLCMQMFTQLARGTSTPLKKEHSCSCCDTKNKKDDPYVGEGKLFGSKQEEKEMQMMVLKEMMKGFSSQLNKNKEEVNSSGTESDLI